jgi:hypothetical protein
VHGDNAAPVHFRLSLDTYDTCVCYKHRELFYLPPSVLLSCRNGDDFERRDGPSGTVATVFTAAEVPTRRASARGDTTDGRGAAPPAASSPCLMDATADATRFRARELSREPPPSGRCQAQSHQRSTRSTRAHAHTHTQYRAQSGAAYIIAIDGGADVPPARRAVLARVVEGVATCPTLAGCVAIVPVTTTATATTTISVTVTVTTPTFDAPVTTTIITIVHLATMAMSFSLTAVTVVVAMAVPKAVCSPDSNARATVSVSHAAAAHRGRGDATSTPISTSRSISTNSPRHAAAAVAVARTPRGAKAGGRVCIRNSYPTTRMPTLTLTVAVTIARTLPVAASLAVIAVP